MTDTRLTASTLRGVWPALITPWDDRDGIDERVLAREVAHFAASGCHGVYTGGTTGEFYAQDDATFAQITAVTCAAARDAGVPVQIGCTTLSTRTACERTRRAVREGADGIQVAIPFWLELKDDEAIGFLADVAEAAGDVPLILYHTLRAKRKLSPELLARAVERVPTLIGMKDTGANVDAVGAILRAVPAMVVFGAEHDLVAKMRAGTRGTYSSVTGLNARLVVALYDACAAGRWDEAQRIETPIARLMTEVLIPMVRDEGLMDSAVDRAQRIVGGGEVGLACERPYRSATPAHVDRVRAWCAANAPELLDAVSV